MNSLEERKICEVAAKLAQKYIEVGAYRGYHEENVAFEIAVWYMERMGLLTFGVVSCDCEGTEASMRYVNRGETYAVTVYIPTSETLGTEGQEFQAGCWGDWYEAREQEYCEEHDTIRCGYCSHLTPMTPGVEWSEVVCESCGHYVGGGGKPEPKAVSDD